MTSRLRHIRPRLEMLEDRLVPATIKLIGGNLYISNPTVTGGSASLTVTAKGTNLFQVQDGAVVQNNSYTVGGNIYITGSNAKDTIVFNLNGNKFTGNLSINGQDGNDSIGILGTGAGNVIGGNVTLLHTTGNESINLNPTAGSTMNIGGAVNASNTVNGFNTFQLGNLGSTTNPSLSPTTIGGDVSLYGFSDNAATPAVQIGAGQFDSVGGHLSVTNTSSLNASVVLGASVTTSADPIANRVGVTVGNGFTVQEPGSGNDTVTILGSNRLTPAVNLGTTINGDTYINMGNGNDFLNVAGDSTIHNGGQQTVFNGNVTFIAGSGNDSINLAGGETGSGNGSRVNGNLTIQFGDGNNDFGDSARLGGTNAGLDHSEAVIAGSLNITAGNGNNVADAMGLTVQGNDNFHFGNGQNGTAAIPILIRRAPGGTLNWTSGNGNNSLELAPIFVAGAKVGPQNFNVNVHFGNGDDTFSIGDTGVLNFVDTIGGTLTGLVDGGGRLNGNVFLQNASHYTLLPTFTLSNFP